MRTSPIRKSHNRLQGYNYSQPNYYFVTTCVENKREWFGKILNNEMILNSYGKIVLKHLEELPGRYKNIDLDTFVVMPNHVHAIVIIVCDNKLPGNSQVCRDRRARLYDQKKSLSKIIGDVKSFSSREINKITPVQNKFKWQRSFYDHVIRNEQSLQKIREYIINNPANWADDDENTNKTKPQ
ncbi:MAG: transposase [Candidatus Omnitrophota bacterium]